MRSGSRHRGEAGGGWLFGFPPLLATDGRIHKGDYDMRTGAIFARGSCRALKWMALFGLVVALGAGSAVAQTTGVTITGPSNNTVNEGGTATYTVAVRAYVGVAPDADTPNNPGAFNVALGVPDPDTSNAAETGEAGDLNSNAFVLSVSFDPPSNSSTTNRLLFTGSQTISVGTLHDNDAENERFTIEFATLTGVDQVFTTAPETESTNITLPANKPTALIIDDDETQGYTLTQVTRNPTEGAPITVHLTASPAHEDGSGTMRVNIDKPTAGATPPWTLAIADADTDSPNVNPAVVTGPGPDATVELTITQIDGDGNRVTDTVTVSAHTGVAGASVEQASLSIDVADADALQAVTAKVVNADGVVLDPQPMSVEEGESVKIAVMPVDKDGKVTTANEKLTIALAPSGSADARDFRLSAPITIAASQNKSNVVDLIVETDEDVGMETLMLDATVSGNPDEGTETKMVAGVLELELTDATDKRIQPKSEEDAYPLITGPMEAAAGDDGLNPGESFMVPMDDLFTVMAGYTATYAADSDGSAVSISERGDVVTITAEEQGTSKVTITGTASMAGSSFAPSQTVSNVAHVAFEVMVADKMVMVTSLTAEPMEIDEGGMSTITATLNRAVTSGDGEVMIGLSVVGDGTLDMDSIAIAMGEMSGAAMLTAAEDDDYMDTEVTVVATGSGIDGTMQVTVMVNDLDEAPVDDPTVRAKDDAADMIAAAIATAAGDADWMVGGMLATVDMSELFEVDEGVTAVYSGTSSDQDVVKSMTTGDAMLALTPMGAGSATITVTASDPSAGDVATVTHDTMVALQTLMIEVTASAHMVDEGGSVTLTAQANRMVTADTVLTLTVTGDTDAVDAPESLMIDMGADMGTAMVMAVEDDNTADEMVTVVVSGSVLASPVSIEIGVTDNDRTVVAKSQEQVTAVFVTAVAMASGSDGWLPGGEAAMVDMGDLFTIEDGASVEYMAESSAEDMVTASASGSMLTLTPMTAGGATITVTATDTSGDADDHAMVMADVEVGVLPLMVELHGPDDMNLVEGNSYEIKAMANRAVTEDTTVEIMRDRAESSAGGDDYSVENITIAAGETMGATMVMVTDDGPGDAGAGMSEKLVLYGMVGNMQTNSLSFYVWDAAVPALPVIAQLLLAAFLAIGGYRRYRRR